jgi:hypothetical protein
MCRAAILACLALAACSGVAWNTTVADTAEVRMQMVQSVRIGVTTDDAFVVRWGPPLQKAREGGRVDFIYRRQNESARFVIVTFDYGVASGVRSTETEACRATFAPRVPGYGADRPGTVHPVGFCARLERPGMPPDSVGITRDPQARPLPK